MINRHVIVAIAILQNGRKGVVKSRGKFWVIYQTSVMQLISSNNARHNIARLPHARANPMVVNQVYVAKMQYGNAQGQTEP